MGKRTRQTGPHTTLVHFDLSQNSFVEFKKAEAPAETARRVDRHRTTSSSSCSSGGPEHVVASDSFHGILKPPRTDAVVDEVQTLSQTELCTALSPTSLPLSDTKDVPEHDDSTPSTLIHPPAAQLRVSKKSSKNRKKKKKNRGVCLTDLNTWIYLTVNGRTECNGTRRE